MRKILAHKTTGKTASSHSWLWLYITLFIGWAAFYITIVSFFVSTSIKDVETRFIQYSNAYAEHIYDKATSNQIILEGFSALFGALGKTAPKEASRYARQVIANHPHIYSLEIVQTVPRASLAQFARQQRKAGYANFQIKTFGYESDRKWHAAEDKPVYYPIVFIDPVRPESADVFGLDMGSVSFLRPAILESIGKQRAVSTPPFLMAQGRMAYVIFLPIRPILNSSERHGSQDTSPYTVSMVVDTQKMATPDNMPAPNNMHLVVYHSDFHPEDIAGQIMHIDQAQHSSIERVLFPKFSFQKETGPSLSMLVEKQAGWADMNLPLLAMLLLGGLISSAMIFAYIRAHYRNSLAEIQSKKDLWFLANHDVLTRLPNRNLFMNRLEQAIARAQRQGRNLGILFIDLNGFKQINDSCGHDAGDQLLKLVAKALLGCIRAEDSVARLGGDEFVVLLEGITDAEVMEGIVQKIRHSLSSPFTINDQQVTISASIGKATFPMHGKTPDELLRFADSKMYSEKYPANTPRL